MSHVINKRIAIVKSKKEKHNTTPLLPVKTLISQGAFAIVSIIGGATTRARVKNGE